MKNYYDDFDGFNNKSNAKKSSKANMQEVYKRQSKPKMQQTNQYKSNMNKLFEK